MNKRFESANLFQRSAELTRKVADTLAGADASIERDPSMRLAFLDQCALTNDMS